MSIIHNALRELEQDDKRNTGPSTVEKNGKLPPRIVFVNESIELQKKRSMKPLWLFVIGAVLAGNYAWYIYQSEPVLPPLLAQKQPTVIDENASMPEPALSKEVIATESVEEEQPLSLLPMGKLNRGMQTYNKQGIEAALPVWIQEFIALPDNTPVLVVMASTYQSHASRTVDKLKKIHNDVYVVPGTFRGKSIYYTIINAHPETTLIDDVQSKIPLNPYAATVATIKDRLIQFRNAVNTSKPVTDNIKPKDLNLPPAQPSNPRSQMMAIRKASEYVSKGQYAKARKIVEPLLSQQTVQWEAWFWAGAADIGLKQWELATQELAHAQRFKPDSAIIRVQQAIVAQETSNHQQAIHVLQQAQQLDASIPEIYVNLGHSFEALSRPNDARLAYQHFLFLVKDNTAYAPLVRQIEYRMSML
ncbi:MAG: hypothetical protein OEZ43_07060 [Gammaproteobacteria bacterium]|nr:hypothetical protein [Gammaproteobacteria bacterium]